VSERTITLHTFASVKGGVGKSTLAIVTAKLLAKAGRVPAVVDCDLTGTSIADGLLLCAPNAVLREDGSVDLDAPPTGRWLSVEETRAARRRRRTAEWRDRIHPPPYLNDVLELVYAREAAGKSDPVRTDAAVWRHEKPDGVLYLPSSALHHDIVQSLKWYNERDSFDWAQCIMWALDDLSQEVPELTDVVLDLPPGTWGFPHEAMMIASLLLKGAPLPEGLPRWTDGPTRWQANPLLITSGDGNDLLPAVEYLGRHYREHLPALRLLANRATEGLDVIRERGRKSLGPALEGVGFEERVETVPEVDVLARIFKEGDAPLSAAVQGLRVPLRLEAKR
jgi:hypothetical protein